MKVYHNGQEKNIIVMPDKICYGGGIALMAGGLGANQAGFALLGFIILVIGCLYAIPAKQHVAS